MVLANNGALEETRQEWVGGEKGRERGSGRVMQLSEEKPALGADGQLYLFGCGLYSSESPWSCHYVSMRVSDKTVHGGWLTKLYYDEWAQSRSAPGVCFFRGDIAFAGRWLAGDKSSENNKLFVAFSGKGIESRSMGDFDDISFIRDTGLTHSILSVGE